MPELDRQSLQSTFGELTARWGLAVAARAFLRALVLVRPKDELSSDAEALLHLRLEASALLCVEAASNKVNTAELAESGARLLRSMEVKRPLSDPVVFAGGQLLAATVHLLKVGSSHTAMETAWDAVKVTLQENWLDDLQRPLVTDLKAAIGSQDLSIVSISFFRRTLWDPGPGPHWWRKAYVDWEARLEALHLGELLSRYREFLEGRHLSSDVMRRQVKKISEEGSVILPPESLQELTPGIDQTSQETEEPEPAEVKPQERSPVGRFTALGESLADRDLLGRQGLIDALAAMFADPQQGTPFTLALLGDWEQVRAA